MSSPTTSAPHGLSRDRIVDEAIALIDEEGEPALSMRRLAQRLGVSTMSTYHHVKDKEALLDAVTDRMMAQLAEPEPGQTWQDAVRTMSWSFRDLTHQHPAVFRLMMTRPRPAGMLITSKNARTSLVDRGLDPAYAATIFRCIVRYLLGSTIGEVGGYGGSGIDRNSDEARAVFDAGLEALIEGFTLALDRRSAG